MIILGQIGPGANSPEMQFGVWAAGGLCAYGIWTLARRLFGGPKSPDPWDETVAAEIECESATPLCHRCLTPHHPSANFCPDCGATVGEFTNWLPYPYLFSIGHTLRIGTSGEFKRSRLTVMGFLLFSVVEYALFAPVYWILFLARLPKTRQQQSADGPPAPVG